MGHKEIFRVSLLFCRFEGLKPAVADRKQKLQESLQWHQFAFDVELELQWIKDVLPAASSTDYGKNLIDAQKLHKKHQVSDIEARWNPSRMNYSDETKNKQT